MKFYGNGYVWDATRGKILCGFVNGELETEDEYTIKKLTVLGYKAKNESEKAGGDDGEDAKAPTRKEILEMAKKRGIAGANRISNVVLLSLLKEVVT